MNNNLKWALKYSEAGYPVIPLHTIEKGRCTCNKSNCSSPGKHPIYELVPNGHLNATTDSDTINRWWNDYPYANIGIRCDSLLVVDIDGPQGQAQWNELVEKYGEYDPTPVVRTGGGGLHIYFQASPRWTKPATKVHGMSIDIRTGSSYVVAPPSTHVSGNHYQWANHLFEDGEAFQPPPEWLLALLNQPKEASHRSDTPFLGTTFDNCLESHTGAEEGERNDTLVQLVSKHLRSFGITPDLMAKAKDWARRCRPPYPENEVERTVDSLCGSFRPRDESAEMHQDSDPTSHKSLISPRAEPDWPEPLGEDARIGIVGDFIELIAPNTEASVEALVVQFLVSFGNVIGRMPYFRVESDRHGTNLFAVIVGSSAKARKGTSHGYVKRLLASTGHESVESWLNQNQADSLGSGEVVVWKVRDAVYRNEPIRENGRVVDYEKVLTDPGVEDKRLLIVEPEFATLLKVANKESSILSPIIRKAWDSGDLNNTTKTNPCTATGAHVSIIGHITVEELNKHLTLTESANGFGNRFVWCLTTRSKLLPDGGRINEERLDFLAARVREAFEFATSTEELTWDEQAHRLWHQEYVRLSAERYGLYGLMTARAEPQVLRIAMIYALLDCSSSISIKHLKAALEVWRYCDDSARYLFGRGTGDRTADKILDALQNSRNGLTLTEIRDLFSRHKKTEDLEKSLRILKQMQLIEVVKESTSGRPTTRVRLRHKRISDISR